jgi:hypothetical protein
MAKMSPQRLSDEVRNNPGLQAEVAVFDALEQQLDNSFTVLYSVEWNAPVSQHDFVQDGEADFIVCHPKHGFLVLEVKGGFIGFDPDEQQWTSTSRSGATHAISNPYKQALKSCHGLVNRMRKMISQQGTMRIFHAVVFPHCLMRPEDLPGAAPSELTVDASGMLQLEQSIGRAFAYWKNGAELRGPSFDEVMGAIRKIHNRPVTGFRNMALEILEHHAEFDRLTKDQMRVMDMVGSNRRLLVRGCAGSGKTFLAKRLAAKRSEQGEKVLTLCFNNLLGGLLADELEGLPNVTATNFHRLCEQLAQYAGVQIAPLTNEGANTYYSNLTEAALLALESDPSLRFDTVIIDEAQDFELDWWIVVEALLNGSAASLTIFTDTNQLLYGPARGIPEGMGTFAEVQLAENVRNTQTIHREALRFFKGETLPSALGPEGSSPRWIEAESVEDKARSLEEILDRLIADERISPNDIAVLTPKGANSTMLKSLTKIGKRKLAAYELREAGEIGWSTIRKFKGLESPVVVITELDEEIAKSERLRELVYVGITRARDYLYLIGSKDTIQILRKK